VTDSVPAARRSAVSPDFLWSPAGPELEVYETAALPAELRRRGGASLLAQAADDADV